MIQDNSKFIIGIGHKARNGKDTLANILKDIFTLRYDYKAEIFHWADGLYEEVRNKSRQIPLIIQRTNLFNEKEYFVLANADTGRIVKLNDQESAMISEIFEQRNISYYWGMDEKDPLILQFWGTNFRRTRDPNYWVKYTLNKINKSDCNIAIIPDTRFINEAKKVDYLIEIQRFHEDGTRYIDANRDPEHRSEIELDDYPADYTIAASSGNIFTIEKHAGIIADKLVLHQMVEY